MFWLFRAAGRLFTTSYHQVVEIQLSRSGENVPGDRSMASGEKVNDAGLEWHRGRK